MIGIGLGSNRYGDREHPIFVVWASCPRSYKHSGQDARTTDSYFEKFGMLSGDRWF